MFEIRPTRAALRVQFIWIAATVAFMLSVAVVNDLLIQVVSDGDGEIYPSILAAAGCIIAAAFRFAPRHTGVVVFTNLVAPALTLFFMTPAAIDVAGDDPDYLSPLLITAIGIGLMAALLITPTNGMMEESISGDSRRARAMFFTGYALAPFSTLGWLVIAPGLSLYMALPVVGLAATSIFLVYLTPSWLEKLKATMPRVRSRYGGVVIP